MRQSRVGLAEQVLHQMQRVTHTHSNAFKRIRALEFSSELIFFYLPQH